MRDDTLQAPRPKTGIVTLQSIARQPVCVAWKHLHDTHWSLECSVATWNKVQIALKSGEMASDETDIGSITMLTVWRTLT